MDPVRLKYFGLTISDIHDAVSRNNQNTGGSYLEAGPYAFYIRAEGLLEEAVALARKDRAQERTLARTLNDLGVVQEALGRYDLALDSAEWLATEAGETLHVNGGMFMA